MFFTIAGTYWRHAFSFVVIATFPFSDNQTPSGTPTKAAVSSPRPKGSVIDLTEDDDDVQGNPEKPFGWPFHFIS